MMIPGDIVWSFAAFDAGGRVVAASGAGPNEIRPQDVWLGPPSQIDHVPDLEGAWSIAWHATEVSRLAFVTMAWNAESQSVFQVWATKIDALTNSHTEPTLVAELDEMANLVRWDSKGFVMQIGDRTVALNPTGEEIWSHDGWGSSASPNFVPHIRQTGEEPQWYLISRASGDRTSFVDLGINATASVTDVIAAQSNDLFAAATHREAGTTLTVVGPDMGAPRIVQLVGNPSPYQFTSDAAFLVFRMADSNDLIFVNWRSGATHNLDVPDNHTVLAINIG
jgi:hypothetical protein